MRSFAPAVLVAVAAVTTSLHAFAADPAPPPVPVPTDAAAAPSTKGKTDAVLDAEEDGGRPEGWSPGIDLRTTFNFAHSQGVVGQQDGFSIALGVALDASLEWNHGMHEWRNDLGVALGATRVPALGELEKTEDELEFESLYLLHALEIFGPFARFTLSSPMLPNSEITPEAVTYSVQNLDGSNTTYVGRRLALTDAFQPLMLRQGLGAFVQPLDDEHAEIELKAGVGAEQTIASGFAIQDDSATPEVEVKELETTYALGAELLANVWGFIDEKKRVSYEAGVDVLVPFKTSDLPAGDDRSLVELTQVVGDLGLNVKIFDWAGFGYKLSVQREPQLVDAWQVTNSLMLTIGGAFGTKAPAPPPPPPCNCKKP